MLDLRHGNRTYVLYIAFLLALLTMSNAHLDFLRKCQDKGHCHRQLHYRDSVMNSSGLNTSLINYFVDIGSLQLNDTGKIKGSISKRFSYVDKNTDENRYQVVDLPFELQFNPQNDKNMFRFRIDENRSRDIKKNIPDYVNINRYSNASQFTFKDPNWFEWEISQSKGYTVKLQNEKNENIVHNRFVPESVYDIEEEISNSFECIIIPDLQPDLKISLLLYPTFKIDVFYKNRNVLSINEENLFNFEHLRATKDKHENISPLESEFGNFRSDSSYYNLDNKKHKFFERETYKFGPQSVGLDFKFKNNVKQVYGIPEHTGSLKLLNTWDDNNLEPYRLFNVDAFSYSHTDNDPLYGSIPFMLGISNNCSIGIFSNNPSDTDVNVKYNDDNVLTHWITETNVVDFVIFVEASPERLLTSYTDLTGTIQLPLLSSLGYHQSRWNYQSSLDLLSVNQDFTDLQIPVDFFWLDIDYTEDRKYFTWLKESFNNVTKLLSKLDQDGSKNLVAIIDPHLKIDYFISDEVVQNNLTIKNADYSVLEAECWPGTSIWLDFMDKCKANELWYQFYQDFLKDATDAGLSNLHAWNDMNEPSLFKKFENTISLDAVHNNGFEHRSLHNLYGLSMHESTYDAMKRIYNKTKRPFVLTRSFFAGSQRTSATWTGDNFARWEYLENSIPVILNSGISGMPFIGADVAGFFENPTYELLVRWYQAAVFYPFFRAHAHIDTTRREPSVIIDQSPYHGNLMKEAILGRYRLINYIYNEFEKSSNNGQPILKPLFWKNFDSTDPIIFDIEDQFYLGDLIVKPITRPGIKEVEMYFPRNNDLFYNFNNYSQRLVFNGKAKESRQILLDVSLESIPTFIEGGSVVFLKDTVRRSSAAMKYDNFTLILAPNKKQFCKKTQFYMDDGDSFEYESNGNYIKSFISYSKGKLSIENVHSNLKDIPQFIEKIVLLGTKNPEGFKVIENLKIPIHENVTYAL